jgi:hypothetical protein
MVGRGNGSENGPSNRPAEDLTAQDRFVPDEKIEIVRKTANSKEECQRLKAELENQGFTVMVREPTGPDAEGGFYVATLFAEKREAVMIDTWAAEHQEKRLRKRDRKIDIAVKAGFWIIIIIGFLFFLYLLGPLIYAIRALF